MISLLDHGFTQSGDAISLDFFVPDELDTIFAAAARCMDARSPTSEQHFSSLIHSLKRRFKSSERPEVCTKAKDSALRKAAKLAYSLKSKGKPVTEEGLEICDGYRATISIPLNKLNCLMDFFTEGAYIKSRKSSRVTIKVTDIENGIMRPEERKCYIPNYDVDFEISYKDVSGKTVTFKAEIQFSIEGAESLLKQSRLSYGQQREAVDRAAIWARVAEKTPDTKMVCNSNINDCARVIERATKARLTAHNKIRDIFDLDGFRSRRQALLQSRIREVAPANASAVA